MKHIWIWFRVHCKIQLSALEDTVFEMDIVFVLGILGSQPLRICNIKV